MTRPPALSVVVVGYEMRRELERTIRSLSPPMQRGIDRDDYELIVVDNGSSEPPDRGACEAHGARIRWLEIEEPSPSPAPAANRGLAAAAAPLVGVLIDGARLASPGLLARALLAARLYPRPVIATLGFHLGPDLQHRSVESGYDRAAEDELLERADWTADGYRLFEVSVLAGSSKHGWYEPPAESNAVFMPADLWSELGGFDERFVSPGGGLVNPDLFGRACALDGAEPIVLLGEATFHQLHGGAATAAPLQGRPGFAEEYERIRGRPFERPAVEPTYVGRPTRVVRPALSAQGAVSALNRRLARRYVNLVKRTLVAERSAAPALLDRVDRCVSTALDDRIPGAIAVLAEAAAPAVLANAILAAREVGDRELWVRSAGDAEDGPGAALEAFGLLDERVQVAGAAPAQGRIAVLLLDAADALDDDASRLVDRVVPGGFVVVDRCEPASDRSRLAALAGASEVAEVGAAGLYWRVSG